MSTKRRDPGPTSWPGPAALLLALGSLAVACPTPTRPPRRSAPPPPVAEGPTGPTLSLPANHQSRVLQGTAPLPLPPDGLLVHLQLDALRGWTAGPRFREAIWRGLRVDSVGAGQVLPYLRRCGVRPRETPRAVTLIQPLDTTPDSDRVLVLWGLVMAQRVVACLQTQLERDGARIRERPVAGEPGFEADRAASDLHLTVQALDDETVSLASGPRYRRALRRLLRGRSPSLTRDPAYQRAVRETPRGTALVALVPRFPKRLPHLPVPAAVPRSYRGGVFRARPAGRDLLVTAAIQVAGAGRAARWAHRFPRRAHALARLLPRSHRRFVRSARPRADGQRLSLRLQVQERRLSSFGRFVSRWLPW